ncbi:MAG: trypsin-like peptidase domain-containing protein [Clostridia bacterium]|nr:trypsin-like peptidase domain-containing protein [Clostridia bacterium]
MLRALGYSDENGADFDWTSPFALSKTVGILPSYVDTQDFIRADVVSVSYAALSAYLKNSSQTLAQKLISMGVFTEGQFDSVYDVSLINAKTSSGENAKQELTAEQIYADCAPAVFYIETYDSHGNALMSGSGFFIGSDGTAITNYHVIENAKSAKIALSETGRTLDVEGVYGYNESEDWAVIKISGTGFPVLAMNTTPSTGGATVYAIGSPLGLQNTISQGIISNPSRLIEGQYYIQTSAAISSGSSGGALINKYGEAIGITCGSYVDGQLLNLAVPLSYVTGYSKASLTPLSKATVLQTGGASAAQSPERQKAAFGALKSWIMQNGSLDTVEDGTKAYMFSASDNDEYGGASLYLIGYYPSSGNIAITTSYVSSDMGIMMLTTVLFEETPPYIYGYEYLPNAYSSDKLEAAGFFYAPTLDESTELSFYSTGGALSQDEDVVYTHEAIAQVLLLEAFELTDYIFQTEIPAYSIADFGFAMLAR